MHSNTFFWHYKSDLLFKFIIRPIDKTTDLSTEEESEPFSAGHHEVEGLKAVSQLCNDQIIMVNRQSREGSKMKVTKKEREWLSYSV